jgi:hypothetical protein
MKIYLLIILIGLLSGCSSKQKERIVLQPDDYLNKLKTLQLDPTKYTSYKNYCASIDKKMIDWLNQIDSPTQLEKLFWSCHKINKTTPESQDQLQWIQPFSESKNLILYRLANIKTPESAKILVDLWTNPTAGWDASAGERATDAVVQLGKLTLPYLKKKKRDKKRISDVITLIESGAKTAF